MGVARESEGYVFRIIGGASGPQPFREENKFLGRASNLTDEDSEDLNILRKGGGAEIFRYR